MALLPTDKYFQGYFEDSVLPTRERNVFLNSIETITISDETAAAYTYTVNVAGTRELRPDSVVNVLVNSGHFTVNSVLTLSGANHLVGDRVTISLDPNTIPSPRTVTVYDDASSPNLLATFTNSGTAGRVSRTFVLQASGLWLALTSGTAGPLQPGGGATVSKYLVGTKTFDPPSVTGPNSTSTTVTVTGAVAGDYVQATLTTLTSAFQISGYVSAADTVTVVLTLATGTVDLPSGTLNVLVTKAS